MYLSADYGRGAQAAQVHAALRSKQSLENTMEVFQLHLRFLSHID